MPWGTSTAIVIRSANQPGKIQTYQIAENGTMSYSPIEILNGSLSVAQDTDVKNNTMVSDAIYGNSMPVYQISKYVKYDVSSGNVVVDLSSGIVVYDKKGNSTTYDSTKKQISMSNQNTGNAPFQSWGRVDTQGQTLVVHISNGNSTTMASLRKGTSSNPSLVDLGNVCRFGPQGIDNGNGSATIIQLTPPSSAASSVNPDSIKPAAPEINISMDNNGVNISASNSAIFSYLMTFLKSAPASSSGSLPNLSTNSDYMLKTQIVPPVCPSCPACNLSLGNVCSNCGGQGGSGTLTCNGTSVIDACGNIILDKNGKPTACTAPAGTAVSISKDGVLQSGTAGGVANNLINTTGSVITGTESNAVGLLQNAGSGASNLAKSAATGTTTAVSNTLSETKNLLEDTGKGVKGFVEETGSGLKSFAEETGSGVKGLLQDTGSGLSKIFTPRTPYAGNPENTGYPGNPIPVAQGYRMNTLGTTTQYTDPYSYSGALPTKMPSNYMPITADFSAFGR
jgi:hypothetical protein